MQKPSEKFRNIFNFELETQNLSLRVRQHQP